MLTFKLAGPSEKTEHHRGRHRQDPQGCREHEQRIQRGWLHAQGICHHLQGQRDAQLLHQQNRNTLSIGGALAGSSNGYTTRKEGSSAC